LSQHPKAIPFSRDLERAVFMITNFLSNSYLTISWDDSIECVIVAWRGFFSGENMKNGAEKALELIKEKNAKLYLSDTSQSHVVGPDDQNWIINDWQPRAVELGLKKLATVVPKNIIARVAMNRLSPMFSDLETEFFDNVEAARLWLIDSTIEISSTNTNNDS
jgi:hypothetical protein